LQKNYIRGVRILDTEHSLYFILCEKCFGPIIDQLGGWNKVDQNYVYYLCGNSKYYCCDVCSETFIVNRRCGGDRRKFQYEIHIPERRMLKRRERDY
jgi:hypothetical protein